MMERPPRHAQKLAAAAALVHLGFVAGGAIRPGILRTGLLPASYAVLSGTQGPYGFFAPSVLPELRATFHMTDGAGITTSDVLETGASAEADRRFKNLVTKLWLARDTASARIFTRSWAARMFQRHPSSEIVTVWIDVYDPPSMVAWQNGERPAWRLRHTETFTRGAKVPAPGRPRGGPS